jgi:hypothetical protein
LPISIFTACFQPGEEFEGILGVALLEVFDAFLDRTMERSPLVVIEVVAPTSENLVERHQLDDLPLRAVGRLVEHEPAVLHVGFDGLHRRGWSLLATAMAVEAQGMPACPNMDGYSIE